MTAIRRAVPRSGSERSSTPTRTEVPCGVPYNVGQCLLHDPVGGRADRRGDPVRALRDGHLHPGAAWPGGTGQVGHGRQARQRAALVVAAQYLKGGAQFRPGVAAGAA